MDFTKLRPADGTAAAIRVALALARTAERTLADDAEAARVTRDAGLIDAAPAALAKAETALAAVRGDLERVTAVVAQLSARAEAAEMAEMLADIEAARELCASRRAAHAEWWDGIRVQLATELGAGLAMKAASVDAYHAWNRKAQSATHKHPGLDLAPPASPADNADWPTRIKECAALGDFSYLARAAAE